MQGIRKAMAWIVVPFTAAIIGMAVLASSPAHAATPSGQPEVTSVQNSAQCLDNSGFNFTAGNPIQVWACGAANGRDQDIKFVPLSSDPNGFEGNLTVTDPQNSSVPVMCIASGAFKGDPFTLQACGKSSDQVVIKFDNMLEFPATGFVMDAKGRSVANGTPVQNWPVNAGLNQQWNVTAAP